MAQKHQHRTGQQKQKPQHSRSHGGEDLRSQPFLPGAADRRDLHTGIEEWNVAHQQQEGDQQ